MSKVNFKKLPTVFLLIVLSVFVFFLGKKYQSNVETRRVNELADFQNQEESTVLTKVKSLSDVKAFLAKGGDRYVWIEDVSDNLITVDVYEYLGDGTTKTFGTHVYDRLTGKITQVY